MKRLIPFAAETGLKPNVNSRIRHIHLQKDHSVSMSEACSKFSFIVVKSSCVFMNKAYSFTIKTAS